MSEAVPPARPGLARFRPYPAYKDSGVEWLGGVPKHWQVLKLKRVCTFAYGDSLASDARSEGDVEVFGSNGPVGAHNHENTLAPCLVIGRKGSFGKINFSPRHVFAIDTTFFVDSRFTRADIRWLYYVLINVRLDTATKDSAVPGLDREDAYKQDVCHCPPDEQRPIATFLDRETARIDALAAKKERLIELLQEKRTALITRAVTKGLDPTIPMKDSRVEWLGKIPAHWEVMPLGQALQVVMDFRGRTPRKLSMDWGGDVPAISAVNVRDGFIDLSLGVNYGSTELHDRWMAQGPTRKGDLLFTTEAPLGNVAMVPDDRQYILSQRVVLLRAHTVRLNAVYLFHFLRSWAFRQGVESRATGSTAEGVKRRYLMSMPVCAPPIDEQLAISAWLGNQLSTLEQLPPVILRAMQVLLELRTALISAAVTGKIDVREAAAP